MGYNTSEGARNIKKVIEREILDQLILAVCQYNFKNEIITIDFNKNSGKLEFCIPKETILISTDNHKRKNLSKKLLPRKKLLPIKKGQNPLLFLYLFFQSYNCLSISAALFKTALA